VRSLDQFAPHKGGALRFTNIAQETPIQEIWAYDVAPGTEPAGTFKLSYTVRADAAFTGRRNEFGGIGGGRVHFTLAPM